jgi:hypothetical protein
MKTLDIHVDREGYKHVECMAVHDEEPEKQLDRICRRYDISRIVDFELKTDPTEDLKFFHIKAL